MTDAPLGIDPKIIAFHLPQFHPIPENDHWWGTGFTEWINVRNSKPLYRGHYQPRRPLHDRYYDLLDPQTQQWQAELAAAHGIYGFCYYHYWFNGKKLLEKPVEQLLQLKKPDFPFCLAWANEPWTRAWDGGDNKILMPQHYGDRPQWLAHIQYLLPILTDNRYIRVQGKPVLLIYRSASIRDLQPMLECWDKEVRAAGLPGLHVVSMATIFALDPRLHLFGGYAEFEPMWTINGKFPRHIRKNEERHRKRAELGWKYLKQWRHITNSYDYKGLWEIIENRPIPPHHYPGAFADWDNSPRRSADKATILRNFSKKAFANGIKTQIGKARRDGAEFLFFNAWNEWAEGTYLEPDEERGLFFLETIRDALVNTDDT